MVNKGIFCAFLTFFLLILVIVVQITIDNFLSEIKQKVQGIEEVITQYSSNLDRNEVEDLVKDLNDYWDNNIGAISFIINYSEISSVGESISRLKAGVEANDFATSNTEIKLLLRIVSALQKILGVRLPNLL